MNSDLVAPLARARPAWEGPLSRKPWAYRITAVVPHLETPETLAACLGLLRLQSERPYLLVIDTGSRPETIAELETRRDEDLEIHYIRAHGFARASDPVAIAMDLAFALCRTEYLFCTHADVFLRRMDFLEWLLERCHPDCPAVGYQMSPRSWVTDQWRGMLGHTATLLHMPTMHRLGVTWSLERAHAQFGIPASVQGWPDTETCMNLVLREAGVQPLLIGDETNWERFVDDNLDHPRSYPGSKLYAADYHQKARTWMQEALREAEERIAAWSSPQAACARRHARVQRALKAYQADWGNYPAPATIEAMHRALGPYLPRGTEVVCSCGECPACEVS